MPVHLADQSVASAACRHELLPQAIIDSNDLPGKVVTMTDITKFRDALVKLTIPLWC